MPAKMIAFASFKGGTVTKANRLNPPSSIGWNIIITPKGNADVVINLPAKGDCAITGAICTREGK